MFCDESIVAAYNGEPKYNITGADAWLDCYHELAYHVTEGYRIVLETEHHYISLDVNGVELCDKTGSLKDFERPREWLVSDNGGMPLNDYESVLFVGERLQSVEEKSDHVLLHFDDFALKIVPYPLHADIPTLQKECHWSYNYVLGAQRHLTRKCSCGGSGELLLDFVSDYVVRCRNCKRSTCAYMVAEQAITEWNSGHVECDSSDIVIE